MPKGTAPGGRTAFGLYALVIFLLYLPAADSGFVSDYTGWLQSLRDHSFADYLNRSHFGVKSLYQVTQFNTWWLYQLLGTNKWAWHLLFVVLHAANALLVFLLLRRIFRHAHFADAAPVAFLGGMLFAVNPYCTEVVVWEASFHYLQALLLMLPVLLLCLRHLGGGKSWYTGVACLLYAVSTFTHELFYLTPLLATILVFWHRFALGWDKTQTRQTFTRFVLPLWCVFLLHLLVFYLVYGARISHVGSSLFQNPWQAYAIKAPFYYYHLGAFGRFWPNEWKHKIYELLRTPAGCGVFYLLLFLSLLLPAIFFRKMSLRGRTAYLLYGCFFSTLLLFVPMWFPDMLLVVGDRYTYLLLVFWSGMVAVILHPPLVPLRRGMTARPSPLLTRRVNNVFRIGLTALLILGNAALTLRTNLLWRHSTQTVTAVQQSMHPLNGKIGLFLNVPASLKGIPVIGYSREGEVRLMHNLLYTPQIPDSLFDVSSYNMNTPADGAHVEVINDSTARVTLNQWGTWWWMGGYGATSYETPYFRVEMTDPGHWYDIILRRDPSAFEIYYQVGDQVKLVEWGKKGTQD